MNDLATLTGVPVIVDPYMITGYKQRRTHKKKRINKKWLKNYGKVPIYDMKHIYHYGNRVIMSQGMFDKLVKCSEVHSEME